MVNKHLVLLVSLISLASHVAQADIHLPLFPGAVIIDESADHNLLNRLIVTGEVKRVRTKYKPESVLNVEGTLASMTLQLEDQRRTEGVIKFYQSVFAETTRVIFECRGRDCGSSSYWANTLLKKALLYGPERHQFYILGKTQAGNYQAVYVAQRGTGAVYAHLVRIEPRLTEAIAPVAEPDKASDMATQLRISGQYQLQNPVTSQELSSLVTYLTNQSGLKLALVVHNALSAGESVADALARSKITAKTLQQKLKGEGLSPSKIGVYAVGPLAPDAKGRRNRTELMRID